MSTGTEALCIHQYVHDVVHADSTLMGLIPGGVWDGPADPNTAYPIVRFDAQSNPIEIRGVGKVGIMVNGLYLIRGVIAGNDSTPLEEIARRLNLQLTQSDPATNSRGTINACVRENVFDYDEEEAGRQFRHLGGIYRFYVE